jgi:hypothetical protein
MHDKGFLVGGSFAFRYNIFYCLKMLEVRPGLNIMIFEKFSGWKYLFITSFQTLILRIMLGRMTIN